MLFVLDGVLAQIAMARTYYESQGLTTLPIDSITTSLVTARALVEAEAQQAEDVPEGECRHPADRVDKQVVGGGNYLLLCHACNQIIEQS